MARKATSAQVASVAARILAMSDKQMATRLFRESKDFFAEIRMLAASARSQDETKGQDRDSGRTEAPSAL